MSRTADGARLALGTLTVLPVRPPGTVDRTVAGIAMALAPVAALPLAVACGLTVWLAGEALTPLLAAAFALAVLALGSGGLHWDGLADTADGLAVPGDRERRLRVMRTGDVGPVGAATLVLVLLVQAAALSGLVGGVGPSAAALTAGVAVVVSRAAVTLACTSGVSGARPDGLGSAVAGTVPWPVTVAVLAVATALAWLVDGGAGLLGVLVAAIGAGAVLLCAWRRLGGVTGDVLGACVELALAGYLVAQVGLLPTV